MKGHKDRIADQAKIQKLSARIADLERASTERGDIASAARLRRARSAPKVGIGVRQPNESSRSPSKEVATLQGGPWEQLLSASAELAQRERQLLHAKGLLENAGAQVLEARARCERLSVEAEVDGESSDLAMAKGELASLVAAMEYHREQVWLLTRECDECRPRGQNLAAAATRCTEGLRREELVSGLVWLCVEAATQRGATA